MTQSNEGLKIMPAKLRALFIVFILIILSASGFYLRFAWNRYYNSASSEAVLLAQSLESLLHPEHIEKLSGGSEDLENPEYINGKLSLMRLVETTNQIRFAYLLAEKNGELIILLDSESPDSDSYSPPGEVYKEASEVFWQPLISGKPVLADPVTDRWGRWISALVPIKDPASEKIIAVFGIDYSISEWYSSILRLMIPDIIITISAILLFLALFRAWAQFLVLKKLSKKLAYDEALYHSVFDQAPIGIAIVNDKSFVSESEFGDININSMFEQILGRDSRALEKVNWPDITHPEDLLPDLYNFELFKAGEITGYSMEKRFIKPDGSVAWANMTISRFLGATSDGSVHLCLLEDISARKSAEAALSESAHRESVLLSHLPGMAYRRVYSPDGPMLYVSAGCESLTGYPPESFIGKNKLSWGDIIKPEHLPLLQKEWGRTVPNRLPYKCEYKITTAHKEEKWVLEMGQGIYNDKDEVEALEGIILDITDRKAVENTLKYNNDHDRWTGLHNRTYLETLLLKDAEIRQEQKRALVGVNLSALQTLTSAYGFHYAQDLLKKIADSLSSYCTEGRLLFNTYENRFVFYLKAYEDREEIFAFCEDLAITLENLLAIERIGGGIGIVEIDNENAHDVNQLLKKLLIASERAIDAFGKDFGACFYGPDMELQKVREEDIKAELFKIAAGETDGGLFLEYQPILALKANRICGFEALARLNSDNLGLVSPLEFIPIAEKTKLIVPLGQKIFIKAFRFLRRLQEAGHEKINISINISVIQLLSEKFIENLLQIMSDMGVEPQNLSLELTESVFSSNYDEINLILGKFKDMGIHISIDDFGTGYSSLARERELNVSCLKIDKHFIDNLLEIHPEKAITGDIISMAHKLGHCVVAEGVEYLPQREYLEKHECDKIQGYLISRPLDEDAAIEFLKRQPGIDNRR